MAALSPLPLKLSSTTTARSGTLQICPPQDIPKTVFLEALSILYGTFVYVHRTLVLCQPNERATRGAIPSKRCIHCARRHGGWPIDPPHTREAASGGAVVAPWHG